MLNIIKKILSKIEYKKEKNMLLELIVFNAEHMMKTENKSKKDAEYLAITIIIDDLLTRAKGESGYKIMIDILEKEYVEHKFDVYTYIGVSTGQLVLKPEYEEKLKKRHS